MREPKEILNLIVKIKESKNITSQELAKRVGIAKSTLSRYESGERNLPINDIGKYASALGVDVAYLLGLERVVSVPNTTTYGYIPVGVAAGLPEHVDSIMEQEVQQIHIPDVVMGKYASQQDIYFMKINGNSMNNIMPNGSLIAIKPTNLANLQDDDVIVYSDDYEYSTKRFINDQKNERFIFRPDSSDRSYSEHHIPYSNAGNLKIHGKVVLHIVETD